MIRDLILRELSNLDSFFSLKSLLDLLPQNSWLDNSEDISSLAKNKRLTVFKIMQMISAQEDKKKKNKVYVEIGDNLVQRHSGRCVDLLKNIIN